jgi:indole-3-glycerol phosphate synthase
VILLIAACLTPAEVKSLATYANSIGLESILELHEEEELDHVCDEVSMIGINNRNLKTFEVDIDRSLRMAAKLPADRVKIAESGISDINMIKMFRAHDFKGFLIGENFMKTTDPALAFENFVIELKA